MPASDKAWVFASVAVVARFTRAASRSATRPRQPRMPGPLGAALGGDLFGRRSGEHRQAQARPVATPPGHHRPQPIDGAAHQRRSACRRRDRPTQAPGRDSAGCAPPGQARTIRSVVFSHQRRSPSPPPSTSGRDHPEPPARDPSGGGQVRPASVRSVTNPPDPDPGHGPVHDKPPLSRGAALVTRCCHDAVLPRQLAASPERTGTGGYAPGPGPSTVSGQRAPARQEPERGCRSHDPAGGEESQGCGILPASEVVQGVGAGQTLLDRNWSSESSSCWAWPRSSDEVGSSNSDGRGCWARARASTAR